jgi:hypothetical protein
MILSKMRSISLKLIIATVAAALLPLAINFAQSPATAPTQTLIEVITTHTAPETEHNYVYLRVFTDGTAKGQPSAPSNAKNAGPTILRKNLSQDEFTRIKSVAHEPALAKVGSKYETKYGVVDSWTEWKIELRRSGQTQTIRVMQFSPGLAKTMKHPYPEALVKLGCAVKKTRADVFGELPSLDYECAKVLGAKKPA